MGMTAVHYDNPKQFNFDLVGEVRRQRAQLIRYTNSNWEYVSKLGKVPAFHIIRDPRDIIVSAYFSHRGSHPTDGWPELIPHRQALQQLDEEAGILKELDFSECVLRDMETWSYQQAHILEIRFEDFAKQAEATLIKACNHIGLLNDKQPTSVNRLYDRFLFFNSWLYYKSHQLLPFRWRTATLPTYVLQDIIKKHSFEKMTAGRKQGTEDKSSHLRKGKSGDWKNHFTQKISDKFNQKYPGLIEKLGYK